MVMFGRLNWQRYEAVHGVPVLPSSILIRDERVNGSFKCCPSYAGNPRQGRFLEIGNALGSGRFDRIVLSQCALARVSLFEKRHCERLFLCDAPGSMRIKSRRAAAWRWDHDYR
jgi:hypothetical protein